MTVYSDNTFKKFKFNEVTHVKILRSYMGRQVLPLSYDMATKLTFGDRGRKDYIHAMVFHNLLYQLTLQNNIHLWVNPDDGLSYVCYTLKRLNSIFPNTKAQKLQGELQDLISCGLVQGVTYKKARYYTIPSTIDNDIIVEAYNNHPLWCKLLKCEPTGANKSLFYFPDTDYIAAYGKDEAIVLDRLIFILSNRVKYVYNYIVSGDSYAVELDKKTLDQLFPWFDAQRYILKNLVEKIGHVYSPAPNFFAVDLKKLQDIGFYTNTHFNDVSACNYSESLLGYDLVMNKVIHNEEIPTKRKILKNISSCNHNESINEISHTTKSSDLSTCNYNESLLGYDMTTFGLRSSMCTYYIYNNILEKSFFLKNLKQRVYFKTIVDEFFKLTRKAGENFQFLNATEKNEKSEKSEKFYKLQEKNPGKFFKFFSCKEGKPHTLPAARFFRVSTPAGFSCLHLDDVTDPSGVSDYPVFGNPNDPDIPYGLMHLSQIYTSLKEHKSLSPEQNRMRMYIINYLSMSPALLQYEILECCYLYLQQRLYEGVTALRAYIITVLYNTITGNGTGVFKNYITGKPSVSPTLGSIEFKDIMESVPENVRNGLKAFTLPNISSFMFGLTEGTVKAFVIAPKFGEYSLAELTELFHHSRIISYLLSIRIASLAVRK